MKEIFAIIRPNKVNDTKEALANSGFPAYTCVKVRGRGKKPYNFAGSFDLSVRHRLLPKRAFMLTVSDEDAQRAVDIIMEVNSTGIPGDGRVFVLPLEESYQVRNGEGGADAY